MRALVMALLFIGGTIGAGSWFFLGMAFEPGTTGALMAAVAALAFTAVAVYALINALRHMPGKEDIFVLDATEIVHAIRESDARTGGLRSGMVHRG